MRLLIVLDSYLVRVTQHDFLKQSDAVFFQKNWRLLSLLSIFELLVNTFGSTFVNAEFPA